MSRKNKRSNNREAMKERARQKLRERAKKTVEGKSGANWMILPEGSNSRETFFEHKKGNNMITILPYEVSISNHPEGMQKGDLWYERSVQIHYQVGAGNSAIVCPRTFNKKCPICEEAGRMWDEGDEVEAKQTWPKRRQIFNVLVDGEVKLWTLSFHLFGKKLEEEILYDEDHEFDGFYFLEKDEGYDLKVRFVEQTLGKNTFLDTSKIDFITRKKDLPEELYDEVFDLDTLIECPDYQKMKELYFEEGQEEEEEEEEERPKRTRRKPRDPEPEPEQEEEEEEEESPKERKRKERKKKKEKSKCPSGHVYGKDCDEYPEDCDDCDKWEDCVELQEKG